MFGYVMPYNDELKIKEYNVFRAYYCGLCKALGKRFSNIVRLGLSYDMTFLALVLSSLEDKELQVNKERCMVHWLNKRFVATGDDSIDYSAYMSILLAYFKLLDDIHDDHSIKAVFGILFYMPHIKRVRNKYNTQCQIIKKQLEELSCLEKQKSNDVDKVADCFAKILATLFTPDFVPESEKKALWWFGYNLGRWIYIIDAVNDLEKDLKSKCYNVLQWRYGYEKSQSVDEFVAFVRKELEPMLTFTLENISKSFELINFKKNTNIIDNILYLGLRNKQDNILGGKINESL